MNRFDGTSARQLDLIDYRPPTKVKRTGKTEPRRTDLRLLRQDVYAELERRRRLAQIAARHAAERE